MLSCVCPSNRVAVTAMCECGYSVNSTSYQHEVFTDLIESDFLTIQDILHDMDWQVQEYVTPNGTDACPFGMNMTGTNIVSNPLQDNSTLSSPSKLGGDAGLQLWVRGGIPSKELVPSAEMRTVRSDLNYGSFRAVVKLTPVNGTCSAVFSVRFLCSTNGTLPLTAAWSSTTMTLKRSTWNFSPTNTSTTPPPTKPYRPHPSTSSPTQSSSLSPDTHSRIQPATVNPPSPAL